VRLRYSTKALALFADPSNATGTRFFGDTTIAPSSRVGLVFAAIFGHCLNAREMLFGIDSSRLSLLDAGGVRLGDIARADEIAMVARRWVARWLDDQRGVASENVRSNFPVQNPSPLIQSLGWIGLGAVRDRMLVCRDLPL
jgi:hypothetical protein